MSVERLFAAYRDARRTRGVCRAGPGGEFGRINASGGRSPQRALLARPFHAHACSARNPHFAGFRLQSGADSRRTGRSDATFAGTHGRTHGRSARSRELNSVLPGKRLVADDRSGARSFQQADVAVIGHGDLDLHVMQGVDPFVDADAEHAAPHMGLHVFHHVFIRADGQAVALTGDHDPHPARSLHGVEGLHADRACPKHAAPVDLLAEYRAAAAPRSRQSDGQRRRRN